MNKTKIKKLNKLVLSIGSTASAMVGVTFAFASPSVAAKLNGYNALINETPNFINKASIYQKLLKLKIGSTAEVAGKKFTKVDHTFKKGFYATTIKNLVPTDKNIASPFSSKTKILIQNKNIFKETAFVSKSGINLQEINNSKKITIQLSSQKVTLMPKIDKQTGKTIFSSKTYVIDDFAKTQLVRISENNYVVLGQELSNGSKYITKSEAIIELTKTQNEFKVNSKIFSFIKEMKLKGWVSENKKQTKANVKTLDQIWIEEGLNQFAEFVETKQYSWITKEEWIKANYEIKQITIPSPLDGHLKQIAFNSQWLTKQIGANQISNVIFTNVIASRVTENSKSAIVAYQLQVNGTIQPKIYKVLVSFERTAKETIKEALAVVSKNVNKTLIQSPNKLEGLSTNPHQFTKKDLGNYIDRLLKLPAGVYVTSAKLAPAKEHASKINIKYTLGTLGNLGGASPMNGPIQTYAAPITSLNSYTVASWGQAWSAQPNGNATPIDATNAATPSVNPTNFSATQLEAIIKKFAPTSNWTSTMHVEASTFKYTFSSVDSNISNVEFEVTDGTNKTALIQTTIRFDKSQNQDAVDKITAAMINPTFAMNGAPISANTVNGKSSFDLTTAAKAAVPAGSVVSITASGYAKPNGLNTTASVGLIVKIGTAKSATINKPLTFAKADTTSTATSAQSLISQITFSGDTNATTITLPNGLENATLSASGLKLQYNTSNGPTGWTDFPTGSSTLVPANLGLFTKGSNQFFFRIVDANATDNFDLTNPQASAGLTPKNLNTYVDTSRTNLNTGVVIGGDTANLTIAEPTAPTGTEIVYSWNKKGTYQPKAAFLAASQNIWTAGNQNTTSSYNGHTTIYIKIRAKSGYVVSGSQATNQPIAALPKVISSTALTAIGQHANGAITVTGPDNTNLTWNINPTLATYANNAGLDVEYLLQTSATAPVANASGWNSTIPTTAIADKTQRHLFIKFKSKAGYKTHNNRDYIIELTNTGLAGINSLINTAASNTHFTITGTSKALAWTAPTVTNATIKYSVDNVTWYTEANFRTHILNKNLWQNNGTGKAAWAHQNIYIKVEPNTGFVVSSDQLNTIPLQGLGLTKIIDDATVNAFLQQIQTAVKATGGNNTAITWASLASITTTASTLGLDVTFSTQRSSGFIASLPATMVANPANRQLFVKLTPQTGFGLSTNKTRNNVTQINNFANNLIKQFVAINTINLNSINISGNTAKLQWTEPTAPTGTKIVYSWTQNGTYVDKAAFLAANTSNIWRSGTSAHTASWIHDTLYIKIIANTGFVVPINNPISKSLTGLTKTISSTALTAIGNFANARANINVTGSDNEHLVWNITPGLATYANNAGLDVEYLLQKGTKAPAANASGWSATLPKKAEYDKSQRHLFIKIKAKVGFQTHNMQPYIIELTNTNLANITTLIKTSTSNTNFNFTGDSTNLQWTEPTISDATIKYSVDNNNFYNKATFKSRFLNRNLWVNNNLNVATWAHQNIYIKVEPHTGFVLSNPQPRTFDLANSSITKMVDAATVTSFLTTINTDVKVKSGNNNHIIWNSIASITTTANNLGLAVKFSTTRNGTFTSHLPTAMPGKPNQRTLFVKIDPKAGYGIVGATQANKVTQIPTNTFDPTGIIKQEVDVSAINLANVIFTGKTNKLSWSGAAQTAQNIANGFHYEFQLIGQKTWQTWNQLSALFNGSDTATNLWTQGTLGAAGSWQFDKIKVRLTAENGYALKQGAKQNLNSTPEVDLDVTAMSLNKYVNNQSISNLITEVKGTNGAKVTGDSLVANWSNLANLIQKAQNLGLDLKFAYNNNAGQPTSGWSTTLPTKLNFTHANRHVWIKVKPLSGHTASNTNLNKIEDITQASGIQNVISKIDTSAVNTAGVILTGDTHNLQAWTEPGTTTGMEYKYSVDGGNSWITQAQLRAKYNGVNNNLWTPGSNGHSGNWLTGSNGELMIKLVPTNKALYVLTSDKHHKAAFSTFTNLKKWVGTTDVTAFENFVNNPNTGISFNPNSLSTKVNWNNIKAITDYANFLGYTAEFKITTNRNRPSITSGGWTATPVTTVDFAHAQRFLWMRFKAQNGYTTAHDKIIDLTAISKIQSIKSDVNISSHNLTTITITGDTHALNINNLPTPPIGSKLVYSYNGNSPTATWVDRQTFIRTIQASPMAYDINNYYVKFAEIDPNKYYLTDGNGAHITKEAKLDTTGLFVYKDVSALKTLMNSATGIVLSGTVAATDGVQIQLEQRLTPTALANNGLQMQYTLDDTTWQEVPALSTVPANTIMGIVGGQRSFTLTIPKPSTGNPILKFRLIPIKTQTGTTVTPPANVSDYLQWVNATKVKLSDFVGAAQNVANINIDKGTAAASLPTLVITKPSDLMGAKLSGDTRHLSLSNQFGPTNQTEVQMLDTANPGAPSYGKFIKGTFSISNGANAIWFQRLDFIKWMNGLVTPTNNIKVWIGNGRTPVNLPAANIKPDWNQLARNKGDIYARWNSVTSPSPNGGHYRPTDRAIQTLNKSSVKYWVDLTKWKTDLKGLRITGQTNNLSKTAFNAVKQDLETAFGSGVFNIITTGSFNGNVPDWTQPTTTNDLPAEIGFDKNLAFKIKLGANGGNFVASLDSNTGLTEVKTVWAKASQSQIDNFIHARKTDLATGVTFTGDTKHLNATIDNAVVKQTAQGIMDANGVHNGLEVLFSLVNVNHANQTSLEWNLFKEYLAGTLVLRNNRVFDSRNHDVTAQGFNGTNYKLKHDGTWGIGNIRVEYKVKSSYYISSAQQGKVAPANTSINTVKRFLDISSLITEANKITTKGDGSLGWWNEATGRYDLANKWHGYIDNKKLLWNVPSAIHNSNLHVKIQYSVDQINWTDKLPTKVVDNKTNRHIWYKYIFDKNAYNIEKDIVISNPADQNITTGSGIQNIKTYVDVRNADLTKVKINGLTNRIASIDDSAANIPVNTHLELSIASFKDINWTGSGPTKTSLASIGIRSAADLGGLYKTSMNATEFTNWINDLRRRKPDAQIKRSWIQLRLVAANGYSIRQSEDTASRQDTHSTPVIVDNLYTYKDVSSLRNQMAFDNNNLNTKVGLFGQQSVADGVVVSIPLALTETELRKLGLKMQWTIDTQNGTTADPNANWFDVQTRHIAANTKTGQSANVPHGFITTITPKNAGQSYLGFRLVPIEDDLGTLVANDMNSNVKGTPSSTRSLPWYQDDRHVKLFKPHPTPMDETVRIDTSKIPVVIYTDKADLSVVAISGDTRHITIFEDTDGFGPASTAINTTVDGHNTDPTLKNQIKVKYAADYINGDALTSTGGVINNPAIQKPIWLLTDEFKAYLNGELQVRGTQIVNKNTGTPIISISSTEMKDWITARKWISGADAEPLYNNLDIHNIFAKWVSINPSFIPSDISEGKIDITTNPVGQEFRKWIDGVKFLNQLRAVKVTGTTENVGTVKINIPNTQNYNLLQTPVLQKLNLKLQYSPNFTTWTDQMFDFQNQKYTVQKAREIFMRIVPTSYTTGNAIPGVTEVQTKEMTIDYGGGLGYGQLITNSRTGTHRDFKYWININKSELTRAKITGTSAQLVNSAATGNNHGINDDTIDTNTGRYNDVEIQYLYGGNWLTKPQLLAALKRLRDAFTNHIAGQPWPNVPSDFNHTTVKAKWVVINNDEAVMKTGQLQEVEIDKTGFKTWINIWSIQKQSNATNTKTYTGTNGTSTTEYTDLQGGNGIDFNLSGTINKVTMSRIGNLANSIMNNHNISIQFTTKENPSNLRNSPDWKPASSLANVISQQPLNPKHKSLYIRFIPTNVNSVASTQAPTDWGNKDTIVPIRIDVSQLKYEVGVHSNDLKNIVLSGDTQSGFTSTVQTVFLDGQYKEEPTNGNSGIRYKTVDANGIEKAVPQADRKTWLGTVGLTVQFKVTATRTRGAYTAGQPYIFNTYALFRAALLDPTHDLNFDRTSLRISWGILTAKIGYQVSDATWVTPNDVSKMLNIIYAADTTQLTNKTYNMSGNTIVMNAGINDQKINTLPAGLKIQWTTDADVNNPNILAANPKWNDQLLSNGPQRLPEHKGLWIRFSVTDQNSYKLAKVGSTTPADIEQITKLDTTGVKIAISLNGAWMSKFQASSVDGQAYAINWNNPLAVVPNSADGNKYGHIEFTVDKGKTWHKVLLATNNMQAGLTAAIYDYYNKGIATFDKDKHHLQIRYVINQGLGKQYMFTDPSGALRAPNTLQKPVNTDKLVQPIITDTPDSNLPIGIGGANMSWKSFATSGKFKPVFIAGTIKKSATLTTFKYDGNDVDRNNNSFYKLDVNKWDPTDIQNKDLWNKLTPRHTHFEFRSSNVDPAKNVNSWTPWSKTPPVDVKTATDFKGLEIRLVADANYEIPSPTLATQFGDQSFASNYNIIIEADVNRFSFDTTSAQFVGFNNSAKPSARFLTDNPSGDYTKGNPIFNILNKSGNALKAKDWKAYVMEYRVLSNGAEIPWTDTNNNTKRGWHAFAVSPDSTVPWYGYPPKSLKNGDTIEFRLRARDGYLLLDSSPQVNAIRDKKGYVQNSHTLGSIVVQGLKTAINIPTNTHIYNPKDSRTTDGKRIIDKPNMPSAIFGGYEGKGTVAFDLRGYAIRNQVEIEVQVLHPNDVITGQKVTSTQFARFGYYTIDNKGKHHKVIETTNFTDYHWVKNSEFLPGTWVDPATINNLSVGDALRIRLKAKAGFAFKWEDDLNKDANGKDITDILYPKSFSKATFGNDQKFINMGIANTGAPQVVPIPVRGLSVLPTITPQQVTLAYSNNPAEKVDGNAVIGLSQNPAKSDKWKWSFRVLDSQTGTWSSASDIIKTKIHNGDKVEVNIIPINSSYKLDAAFKAALKPQIFTVNGLKAKIDVKDVPAPEMVFSGRVGRGKITDLIESTAGTRYDRTNKNILPQPKLGPSATYKGNGVKWEFQVIHENPNNLTSKEIDALPWEQTVPTTLTNGDFVRMRLMPKDPNDIALYKNASSKEVRLYSKPSTYKTGATGSKPYENGWARVTGLVLNPNSIELEHTIKGFKGKSNLKVTTKGLTPDDHGVKIEASYDNGKTWHDPSFFKNIDNTIFVIDPKTNKKVIKSNFLRFRVYAKPTYKFDPKDNALPGVNIYKAPNGITYLERDIWKKVAVTGLRAYLDVRGVSIKLGTAPRNPLNLLIPLWQTGVNDGEGSIASPQIAGANTIQDKDGNLADPATGTPYSKMVKIKYIINKNDPDTGDPLPKAETYPVSTQSITPPNPTKLFNGDNIKAMLYVDEDNDPNTVSQYKLSNEVAASMTISHLTTKITPIDSPRLSFIGKSGYGSANVSPNAPRRTIWQFAVVRKTNKKFVAPDPKKVTWLDESPKDLQIGDYIKVRLVDSINKQEAIQEVWEYNPITRKPIMVPNPKYKPGTKIPKEIPKVKIDPATGKAMTEKVFSKWTIVQGLKETIDLSRVVITPIDNKDVKTMQKPRNTIANRTAFKIYGDQSGFSEVKINKALNDLVDVNNKKIPHSDALVWEFSVQNPNNHLSYNRMSWSTSLPKNLKNSQRVYARLAIKDDPKYSNLEAYGFNPIAFDLKNLKPAAQIASKTGLLIMMIAGIAATAGIAGGILLFVKMRKKIRL